MKKCVSQIALSQENKHLVILSEAPAQSKDQGELSNYNFDRNVEIQLYVIHRNVVDFSTMVEIRESACIFNPSATHRRQLKKIIYFIINYINICISAV